LSGTEQYTGRRYEIVAFANDQKPIFYEELDADGEGKMCRLFTSQ